MNVVPSIGSLFGFKQTWLFAMLLLAVSLLVYLPGIQAPFISTGEPREALVAQTMLLQDDLLKSVRYDDEVATKPPLLHWLMVLSARTFGNLSEAAARLPSVIAASLAAISWTVFLLPMLGKYRAFLFFIMLTTSMEWFRQATHARVDMLLASFVSLALLALFQWTQSKRLRYLFLAFIPICLAALTKGPVGAALPLGITACALLLWRQISIRGLFLLGVLGLGALIPLLVWYYAEMQVQQLGIVDTALHENLHRLLGSMSSGDDPHTHGFFYLFGALFAGLLPWSLFGLLALPFLRRNRPSTEESPQTSRFLEWCAVSVCIAFALFLIPASKRGVYLLPVYPAALTLLSVALAKFSALFQVITRRTGATALSVLTFALTIGLIFRFSPQQYVSHASFLLSPKAAAQLALFHELLRLQAAEMSLLDWFVQLCPILLLGFVLWLVLKRNLAALPVFGVSFAFALAFIRAAYLAPASEGLSPKHFIAAELRDHNPPEIALRTPRMYAEAFYIRQLAPYLAVRNYAPGSKFVLLWEVDHQLITDPMYTHISESGIEKNGEHLEFVILK